MENQEQGQGENLVVVYQAPDEFIASIIKGFLEDDGIPVALESKMAAMYDGALKMAEGYWGDVVVPIEYAERSKVLIEQYHASEVRDEDTGTSEETTE